MQSLIACANDVKVENDARLRWTLFYKKLSTVRCANGPNPIESQASVDKSRLKPAVTS